jgi:mono/diheme cytochrome c family protein
MSAIGLLGFPEQNRLSHHAVMRYTGLRMTLNGENPRPAERAKLQATRMSSFWHVAPRGDFCRSRQSPISESLWKLGYQLLKFGLRASAGGAGNPFVLMILASWITVHSAASAADVEQGRQLARRVCAICHAVTAGDQSADVNAPPFRLIARSQKFRKGGVAFVLELHRRMPNFALAGDEAEDVTAYIKTLGR